jgi:membrane associated rhomboid family serine protease
LNGAVFGYWLYATNLAKTMGDSGPLRFLSKHFTMGVHSLQNWHTFITSQFSHRDIFHFGINMFVLHSFGSTMLYTFGVRKFLSLYAMSGLGCAVSSMYYKLNMHDRRYGVPPPSMGASGCISGVLASFALMYPTSTVSFIFVPMPAWVAFGGLAVYDLYKATREVQGRVDAAGHLGGSMGGLLWYLLLRR